MVSVTTEVEVYLDEIDDLDLIEELRSRNYHVFDQDVDRTTLVSLEDLYTSWTLDRDLFEEKFRDFCRANLGRSF